MADASVTLCVLLWARPGQSDALSAYEDRVLKLLAEHGGQVLQRGRLEPGAPTSLNASSSVGAPTSPDASTLPDASTSPDASTEHAPTEVQFLEFPSEAALDSSINDPRRTAMAAERDAVIARTDIHRIRLR